MVIALITGGFDPIHIGHIQLIKDAQKIGRVVVGLNSDQWLKNKKGMHFLPFEERKAIIEMMQGVVLATGFNDSDGTAIDAIRVVQNMFPDDPIVFCNGGDRTDTNIPEYDYCVQNQVEMRFGVGGGKANSSSWLLSNWGRNEESRPWGKFKTLYTDGSTVKVKELLLEPGKSTSYQSHKGRSEFWTVISGVATAVAGKSEFVLYPGESIDIQANEAHQLLNRHDTPLKVLEVQYGTSCAENDIQRMEK